MRIAAISQHYTANPFRWLCKAFEDLGHDVAYYGPKFPNHMGVPWGSASDFMDDVHPLDAHVEDPDLVVINDWYERTDHHIKIITENPVPPIVLIQPEGWPWAWKRDSAIKYASQPYGIVGHPYDSSDPTKSCEQDGWKWLPGACDPSVHPYLYMDRLYDFVMCATPYTWRPQLCQYLREQGFKVRADFTNVADYAIATNTALATCDFTCGQEFVKCRVFEAFAMGCIVLHTKCELMDRLFTEGVHYIGLDGIEPDFKQVVEALQRLFRDPGATRRMADAARREVLAKHTYIHRARTILKDVGLE